ncbi:amino acid ABC transporter substrate-binding protein, PAAT family [Formivibrio citricus]|uniref:Amino acid ABC transporter substrate-binding protein, PAAT family n=1 Tax=Formivibrio citricus TaxID=83765 RepID=A0A1I5D093_9NEIS|nr:ABC transporter substrate-binding protein [Formivibrio citricus]SFN92583.1 amino acid ABC transporter substrate-binding protein, PAAT family [Formivibrio citricus]
MREAHPAATMTSSRFSKQTFFLTWRARLLQVCLSGLMLACALPAAAESSRLERVLATGSLRVCIWPEYYGITYRHPMTRVLSGIDIDLAHALASDLGVKPAFVDSNFTRVIDDVTQDRCDIAMFAIGILPHRAEKLRFSQPYLQSDIYAITTRSNRRIKTWQDIDKPGVIVAVAKGTLHEPVMKERLKQAALLVVAPPGTREQEVESGRADVFMTDYPYSRRMLETTDWARLIEPASTFHLTSYAYAVQKGDDTWYARIERFVQTIKQDGRLRQAARKNGLEPIVLDRPN